MPLLRQARREAVTASVAPVDRRLAEKLPRTGQGWQRQAFGFYDQLPEVWYGAQFYAKMLSKLRLVAQRYDEDADEWVEDPTGPASDFLATFHDPGGEADDRGVLLGTYGRLRFIAGECYLLLTVTDSGEEWEVVSKTEMRPKAGGKGYQRIRAEGFQPEDYDEAPDDAFEPVPDTVKVWRLWRRHPQFSMQADSPMRAVLDVCEELVVLTQAVRARARSRIAQSGFLLIPTELMPPPTDPVPTEDAQLHPFLRNLIENAVAPLSDPGASSNVFPVIISGAAQWLAGVRQLHLETEAAAYPEAQLRSEAISRLANGLDMPREILLGTGDVNHWNAWQIDDQTWKGHGQPVAEELCGELSSAILAPTLEEAGVTGAYRIWYDAAAVVNHPDRGKDATDVYDRGELSGAGLREAKGFDEANEPSLEERARYIGVRVRDAGLAWYGEPTLRKGAAPEGGEPLPTEEPTGTADAPGPPPTLPSGEPATVDRLLGACETALYQCRRTAGSRIVQATPRAERARLERVPKHQVAATIGREALARLNGQGSAERLVQGGTDALDRALAAWGYEPERREAICRLVSRHAARTLLEAAPEALPPIILRL